MFFLMFLVDELYVISFVTALYTSTGVDAASLLMGAIVNVPAAGEVRAPPVAFIIIEFTWDTFAVPAPVPCETFS